MNQDKELQQLINIFKKVAKYKLEKLESEIVAIPSGDRQLSELLNILLAIPNKQTYSQYRPELSKLLGKDVTDLRLRENLLNYCDEVFAIIEGSSSQIKIAYSGFLQGIDKMLSEWKDIKAPTQNTGEKLKIPFNDMIKVLPKDMQDFIDAKIKQIRQFTEKMTKQLFDKDYAKMTLKNFEKEGQPYRELKVKIENDLKSKEHPKKWLKIDF